MLKIREEQRDAMRVSALDSFKSSMVEHLRGFAPERCKAAGDQGLDAFIDQGVTAAAARGLRLRGPVRLWLEIGIVLGAGFDQDPQYPFLMPDEDSVKMPMPFAERLHKNAVDYLNACFGPDKQILVRIVKRVLSQELPSDGDTASYLSEKVTQLWPEKVMYAGTEPIEALVKVTDETATELGLQTTHGRFLSAILGLFFGADVIHDPLYPWLHNRLAPNVPEDERIDRTIQGVKTYLAAIAERYSGAN